MPEDNSAEFFDTLEIRPQRGYLFNIPVMANERQVVVTGMGVLSSVGTGLDEFWRGLVSGKNGIGRLMSAAEAVEFIATVMSVFTGIVPPTLNFQEPDPECPLDYVPGRAESLDLKAALSNSFGFGGGNACLAVTKIGGNP